jgi:hypothetical protein
MALSVAVDVQTVGGEAFCDLSQCINAVVVWNSGGRTVNITDVTGQVRTGYLQNTSQETL